VKREDHTQTHTQLKQERKKQEKLFHQTLSHSLFLSLKVWSSVAQLKLRELEALSFLKIKKKTRDKVGEYQHTHVGKQRGELKRETGQ